MKLRVILSRLLSSLWSQEAADNDWTLPRSFVFGLATIIQCLQAADNGINVINCVCVCVTQFAIGDCVPDLY